MHGIVQSLQCGTYVVYLYSYKYRNIENVRAYWLRSRRIYLNMLVRQGTIFTVLFESPEDSAQNGVFFFCNTYSGIFWPQRTSTNFMAYALNRLLLYGDHDF